MELEAYGHNNISIHALREEGDQRYQSITGESWKLFLSTPSARRATFRRFSGCSVGFVISIHALREEGDWSPHCGGTIRNKFLSTPSARRATWHTLGAEVCRSISIHALREEGDINLL